MGHLSPIDGIGPDDLGLNILAKQFATGQYSEVILATNPTVEGEATAHFIAELAQQHQVIFLELLMVSLLAGIRICRW